MTKPHADVSPAFAAFGAEAPIHAEAWRTAIGGLAAASALDRKTHALAYLAVLAALQLQSGLPFHVALAKDAGATREEIVSALLVGLPAAGVGVVQALPGSLAVLDGAA